MGNLRRAATVLQLIAFAGLAGCLADSTPGAADAPDMSGQLPPATIDRLFSEWPSWEPTIAVAADGTVYATSGWGSPFVAQHLDGTIERLERPLPREAPFLGAQPGDAMIQIDAQGRLVYHALLYHYENNAAYSAFILLGIHVAVSEDGGHTWPINTYLSLPDSNTAPQIGADRQWMTLALDGTMYLVYQRVPAILSPQVAGITVTQHYMLNEPAVMFSRSDDGGRTWSDFKAISGGAFWAVINGQPVTAPDGTLFVPFFTYSPLGPSESALLVAISSDRGATFETRVVYSHPDGPGAWFPSLVLLNDSMVMAWLDAANNLQVATSEDEGKTWGAPHRWSPENQTVATSPWALVHDGILHILWFSDESETTSSLWWSRAQQEELGTPVHRILDPLVNGTSTKRAMTDFAHGVITAEGHLHTVWSDLEDPELWHLMQPLSDSS